MTKTIQEGKLTFVFDDTWTVEKYDSHRDYTRKLGRIPDSKAIDFVAIRQGLDEALFFIEVKDFRGFRTENKSRISNGELAIETAQKVRDSIAGLIGAWRTSGDTKTWAPYVRGLCRNRTEVRVLLWIEQDLPKTPREKRAVSEEVLAAEIKQRLRWLTTKVIVASLGAGIRLAGLTVTPRTGT